MKAKNILLLFILALLWGPSFLFIKVAVREIPPLTLTAWRIGTAAIALNLFLWWKGGKIIRDLRFWKRATIAGFFAQAFPFTLINWGEMHIDSALASILNGLTPIFTIIAAHFFVKGDTMNPQKILGVLLGFTGLLILISPSISSGIKSSSLGILSVSTGAVSYGIGMVYSRLKLMDTPPLHAPAAQLLTSSLYMIPLSLWRDGAIPITALSGQSIGSVLVLGTLGTAVAFVLYFRLLERAGPSYLSLTAYLMPVFGVLLGIIILGESLTKETIIGAITILSGLAIANGQNRRTPQKGSEKEDNNKDRPSEDRPCVKPKKNKTAIPLIQVRIR